MQTKEALPTCVVVGRVVNLVNKKICSTREVINGPRQ